MRIGVILNPRIIHNSASVQWLWFKIALLAIIRQQFAQTHVFAFEFSSKILQEPQPNVLFLLFIFSEIFTSNGFDHAFRTDFR